MASKLIPDERIKTLNDKSVRNGQHVLYWMQQSQRAEDNHALEHAVQQANKLGLPLLVVFGLMDDYPEANLRHYTFMLEGLQETQQSLKRRGIKMVVQHGKPDEVAIQNAHEAALVVCDRGYLRHQRAWRENVANEAPCRVVQIESDVVVPVETASNKAEYAARTIRPKIHKHLEDFLVELRTTPLENASLEMDVSGLDLSDVDALTDTLKLDRSVGAVGIFKGGTTQAKTILRTFLDEKFATYDDNRNQPHTDDVSHMSKYLHFGQISPVYLAMQIREAGAERVGKENIDSYIEELTVRRELAMNFVYFTPDTYDSFDCLPNWAQKTLGEHRDDAREYLYDQQQLEDAETHDEYWNAAMKEMRYTGYMHNYMRMYWGKKILEWSPNPREAYRRTLDINNKYFLDGRDPNSFGNVAWVFGLHDRAWTERAVYGKVRYMAASGLKRKTKPEEYVAKVEELIR